MPISNETHAVLEYFDQYSGFTLRKKNDIAELLDIASLHDEAEAFNTAVFTGKIVWNLYAQLKKITAPPSDSSYHNLEQEFAKAVNELRGFLLHFATISQNDATQQRFEETYLTVHQGTMRNIVDLAHDLARFKDMQSDAQRGKA